MYPNEARLKNLTYGCNIYCDIDMVIKVNNEDSNDQMLSITKQSIIEESLYSLNLESHNQKINENKNIITFEKINMGLLPIMLHSKICVLHNNTFDTL